MAGLFKNIIYFSSIIFIHEIGHFLTAKVLGWNVDRIYFYPYGGFTKFNDDLNKPKKEELIIMIMGPLFQIIYYFLISSFLTINELALFKSYHYSILLFNLLPIYPLDGGKLLNVILNYFTSFRRSLKLTLIFSYVLFIVGIVLTIVNKVSSSLSMILVLVLIMCKLTEETKKERFYFNKFLLERYLNDYKFPKIKVIKGIEQMSRDYKHVIFYNGRAHSEKEELGYKFKQKNDVVKLL